MANKQQKGFTIIEVVLVLAIAGLIFLIVFLALPSLQRSQRDTQRRNDASRFMSQLQQYQSNNRGVVPLDDAELDEFVNEYMTNDGDTFADPSTGNVYDVYLNTVAADEGGILDETYLGKILYHVDAQCAGEDVEDGNGQRSVAIRLKLEGAGHYCLSN